MSRRRSLRDCWYAEVIRSRLVSGACRELLSLLAVRHMTDGGHVQVPRATVAAELGIAEPRVTVRIREAVGAGLLSRVGGGINGQTQRYAAVLPPAEGVAERHPQVEVEVTGERHPQNDTLKLRLRVSQNDTHTYAPARARALTETRSADGSNDGSRASPRDAGRGTRPRLAAAAIPPARGDGQNGLGDYSASRTRLATEVEQGNHRPRARENGHPR